MMSPSVALVDGGALTPPFILLYGCGKGKSLYKVIRPTGQEPRLHLLLTRLSNVLRHLGLELALWGTQSHYGIYK